MSIANGLLQPVDAEGHPREWLIVLWSVLSVEHTSRFVSCGAIARKSLPNGLATEEQLFSLAAEERAKQKRLVAAHISHGLGRS
jgi:hypothetical protein